jgi:hypothetical protein
MKPDGIEARDSAKNGGSATRENGNVLGSCEGWFAIRNGKAISVFVP